ncbi:DUF3306 domain-containing protein [Methylobacterium sp. Leaf108]|uniref:DUF3306 domain-containing protein n=1 Tax=Methylobacterium sp. Leaf108 TaxID=1736256 RepID=UPI0006F635AC|nr:DUF3306 domain-containing protein [Methylobacterium sp. Leaf108]KQP51936.1 hypothetical protein ASF39_09310 [Methylobacterium sp. Leaf108]
MAGDDFLSRWSRRKREIVREEAPPELPTPDSSEREAPPGPGDEPLAAASADDEAHAGIGDMGDMAGIDEDAVAALPSLDSLTADSDLAPFLKAGVPQVLRNAAMRRMWSLDPGIRDYLGEAREYAFDWHIPGAVPGTGPMLPTDDIAGMVRQIFAGSKPRVEVEVEAEAEALTNDADADADAVSPVDTDAPVQTTPAAIAPPAPPPAMEPECPGPELASQREPEREKGPSQARLRRHGGALPI